jgi:hypothetical protein
MTFHASEQPRSRPDLPPAALSLTPGCGRQQATRRYRSFCLEAAIAGRLASTTVSRPERNPSSTFWLVYGREGERALPSAE